MKRISGLVTVILVTCSICACTNKNASLRNQSIKQGGTNMSIDQSYNQGARRNKESVAYKDGMYLGEGVRTSIGNQAAVVTIKDGKIQSILLKTLDVQGREVNYNSQHPNSIDSTGRTTGTRSGSGTPESGTTDGIAGGMTGGAPGGATGGTTGGPIGGSATGGAINNLEQARRDLVNAMISKQSYDVSINSGDAATVENWKLAVKRALESAYR